MDSRSFEPLQHFNRLKIEQENYLKIVDEKLSKWMKFKTDYLSLKQRLETLPHELKYDIMVPISKVAFMPGRLINTNEILVLLGDNWFVEKSAKQACDLIARRLSNIDAQIDEIGKEKHIYTDQIKYTTNLMQEKGEYVNIEEKFEESDGKKMRKKRLSDDEIRELRKRQQERAARAQESINQELKRQQEELHKKPEAEQESEHEDEDDYEIIEKNDEQKESNLMTQIEKQFRDLDLVNMGQEETALNQMIREYDRDINRENNEAIEKAFREKLNQEKKQVKWIDTTIETRSSEQMNEIDKLDEEEEEEEEVEETFSDDFDSEEYYDNESETRTARSEEASHRPIVIKIKHTQNEELRELERRRTLSRDKPELDNPGDIYNMFYKPKSILKNKNDRAWAKQNLLAEKNEHLKAKTEPKNAMNEKFEPQKAFTGEIVEKPVRQQHFSARNQESTETMPTKKPVSKFRASKINQ